MLRGRLHRINLALRANLFSLRNIAPTADADVCSFQDFYCVHFITRPFERYSHLSICYEALFTCAHRTVTLDCPPTVQVNSVKSQSLLVISVTA